MFSATDSKVQWNILHGLLKDAVYGGRIDDHQDEMKIATYLSQFFNDDNYHNEGRNPIQKLCKAFNLPRSNDINAYKAIISELSEIDNVTLMGLPANIDRVLQINISNEIILQLNQLKHFDVQMQKYNKEQWSQQLYPLLQIWKRLTSTNDIIQKKADLTDSQDPIVSYFELESFNAIQLVQKINLDLQLISKILSGASLISNEIQKIASCLLKGETPLKWLEIWEGSVRAPVYIEQVVSKLLGLLQFKDRAISNSLLGSTFQMDKAFNHVAFLNALRQSTSRKLKVPMDTLKLVSSWSKPSLLNTIEIEGLLVQGCRCDGTRFIEAEVSDSIFNVLPNFFLYWVSKEEKMTGFSVPIYTNPKRDNHISNIIVPFNQNQTQWILAGVAFFIASE
jgi:dynein heavy chain 2, cytosolic